MVFNFGPTMQTLGFLSLFLFCFFNFWVGERERKREGEGGRGAGEECVGIGRMVRARKDGKTSGRA